MSPRKHDQNSPRKSGFTLLEMLLVLAILVAITAVTIPVVERMYDAHRIRQSATTVRTALSAARLRAVDRGQAYECRVEPDGRHLVVLARRGGGIRFGDEEDQPASASQPQREAAIHIELPEPLVFQTADSARERLEGNVSSEIDRGSPLRNRMWSKPIVFAPNGSSTNAEFEIRDPSGRSIQVEVRGLTGAARTSTQATRGEP